MSAFLFGKQPCQDGIQLLFPAFLIMPSLENEVGIYLCPPSLKTAHQLEYSATGKRQLLLGAKFITPMRYKFYENAAWDRPGFQLEAHPLNDK